MSHFWKHVASASRLGLLFLAFLTLGVHACTHRGRPAVAGDLHVGLGYDVSSLDPHLSNTHGSVSRLSNVYEPLVGLDRRMRLVAVLAESWSNPSATTWSFRLRPGVRFHDGSPLTAQDVVYSLLRLKRDESLAMRSQLSEMTDAAAENGEVVVRTRRPSACLLVDLSLAFIVPAGATRESLEAHPNGTGPYAGARRTRSSGWRSARPSTSHWIGAASRRRSLRTPSPRATWFRAPSSGTTRTSLRRPGTSSEPGNS